MPLAVNYTNGFDYTPVTNALLGRLAWRQIGSTPVLNDANKTSKSNRFFDGFHALCNIVNIKNAIAQPAVNDEGFNALLQSMYKDVILRSLNGVFSEPQFIDRQTMVYDRFSPSVDQVIENTGRFVGYVIDVPRRSDIAVQIDSVKLYFNEAKQFNLQLFAEGNSTALFTKEVSAQANTPVIVELDNLILNYIGSVSRGSRFFFGCFQSDLGTAKSIREQGVFAKTNCFSARPFSSVASGSSFQFARIEETNVSFGLNLEMSSFKDYTRDIIKKAFLFDELIGLQMTAQVIEGIMHSTRSNGNERMLKEGIDKLMVYMDLKGTVPISDAPNTTGIAVQIERELEKLKLSFYKKSKAQTINLVEEC
jgi:hypothetical protein